MIHEVADPNVANTTPAKINLSPVQNLLDLISERCEPVSVWLFGSRAKGTAREDSDWDLLVILSDSVPVEEQENAVDPWELRRLTRVNAEILCCGASDFRAASDIPNTLAYEIARTGVVV
jgi:predicted nucleotidyltransferase